MIAISRVTSVNIQIAGFQGTGTYYSLYIKKNLVSAQSLLKIEEVCENHGVIVTSSDSHYIIT